MYFHAFSCIFMYFSGILFVFFRISCISKVEVKHQDTDGGGLQTAPASTAGLFQWPRIFLYFSGIF